jgi:hypothetical protein
LVASGGTTGKPAALLAAMKSRDGQLGTLASTTPRRFGYVPPVATFAQPEPRSARQPGETSWIRNSKLAFACFGFFALFLVAQSLTGWRAYDADQRQHGEPTVGYLSYLTTGHFVEATFENWESEFLQMAAFVLLTAFLVQKGSAESKPEGGGPSDEDPRLHRDEPDAPWPVRRGGVWLKLYENSLLIAFVILFAGSIAGHALGGAREYSSEQQAHGAHPVGAWEFVRTSEFWFQSFQNWQSEFLAVGSIVVLSIMLRQRGSPESKPVHAPVDETGA